MQVPVSLDPSMRSLLLAALFIPFLSEVQSSERHIGASVYDTGPAIHSSDCLVTPAKISSHSAESNIMIQLLSLRESSPPPPQDWQHSGVP
jgi:hypothetical protein